LGSKRSIFVGSLFIVLPVSAALAQQLTISSVSMSPLGKSSLCTALGGSGAPPTVTIKHSKAAGQIRISMTDQLNNGRTVDHGGTTAAADPSGTTTVKYNFLPPCNRRTGEGLKSAYYVTATAGGSSKTILWGRYP
jgi:hypothetical protein